jgi:hypothetical protein
VSSTVAQRFQVASFNGEVSRLQKGAHIPLSIRETVQGADSVSIGEGAFLSVIDKNAGKLYALKSQKSEPLATIVKNQQQSTMSKFVSRFVQALMRGDTEKISHTAHVIYKDVSYDKQVYAALSKSDYRSVYPLSMRLIDAETGREITGKAAIGRKFFFRITNDAPHPVFVNVLDISSDGSMYDCFPIDEGGTMLHLLMPAQSVREFRDYPMEFSEPAGNDRLLLIACEQPFDLRNIIRFFEEKTPAGTVGSIGLFEMGIHVVKN